MLIWMIIINDTFEKVIFSSELRQFITTETQYTDTNFINRTPASVLVATTILLTAQRLETQLDYQMWWRHTNANGIIDKLADGSAFAAQPAVNIGKSNNGVVYPPPYTSDTGRIAAVVTNC